MENNLYKQLYDVLLKLKSHDDVKILLDDLCTFKEVEQMAQRIECARLLLEGKTYNQVIAETEISSATLSRVSKCIRHGSGGYKKFINTEK